MDAIQALSSSPASPCDVRLTVPLLRGRKPFITFHCSPTLTSQFIRKREKITDLTEEPGIRGGFGAQEQLDTPPS